MARIFSEDFLVKVEALTYHNKNGLKMFEYDRFLQRVAVDMAEHMLAIGAKVISTEYEGKIWFLAAFQDSEYSRRKVLTFSNANPYNNIPDCRINLLSIMSCCPSYILDGCFISPASRTTYETFGDSLYFWLDAICEATKRRSEALAALLPTIKKSRDATTFGRGFVRRSAELQKVLIINNETPHNG